MKYTMKRIFAAYLFFVSVVASATSPIHGLLERIDRGASKKFVIEKIDSDGDVFELDQKGDKVVIRGNNYVSMATGLNWYLKYHAGIHLSWNGMTAELPDVLPKVQKEERHRTCSDYRYCLNYCTFSYSMAFWDWKRWEKEIDWMALHGINLSLAVTGMETVWFNVLERIGYSCTEIDRFISGPAFFAWWLMNNLEAWGGPNPKNWYSRQAALQKKILKRMREYGIEPVLPGYCGMMPSNVKEKLGLNVADPGMWCGFRRPTFLQPEDARFGELASVYYEEMEKLYGKANFYSMDPFHEGGNAESVNLVRAGAAIMQAMKKANPDAVWVIQAWGENPRPTMIDSLAKGDLLVLDLYSESRPQWGDASSSWFRKNGFGKHDWMYCMLLNFGGNVGLFGKMDNVIDAYYLAKNDSVHSKKLKGVGMTPEGIGNNPVMYELLMELPWRETPFVKEQWIRNYATARYGCSDETILQAWFLLAKSIYNCPKLQTQQGTHESVFCASPALDVYQVSRWSEMKDYYNPQDVIKAAELMLSVADEHRGNNNFEYDLVDVVRQAVAERGRMLQKKVSEAYRAGDREAFSVLSARFLELIRLQDELLGTRSEFKLGDWIAKARNCGKNCSEKKLYEWNARVQVTTWGNRQAAEQGGLRDYAHKEWNGLLNDFYFVRWKLYFEYLEKKMDGEQPQEIDFYRLEEQWTHAKTNYSAKPYGDCVNVAKRVFDESGK